MSHDIEIAVMESLAKAVHGLPEADAGTRRRVLEWLNGYWASLRPTQQCEDIEHRLKKAAEPLR